MTITAKLRCLTPQNPVPDTTESSGGAEMAKRAAEHDSAH
ncbi:MAG: hypothetical protein K0R84_1193 [Clostridia bacterium]|jgi:hypothetical protein|nr:hypothetical protein [Clostridia bacterium]